MPNDLKFSQIIVARAKKCDTEALAFIYEQHFDRIYRYILAHVHPRETAEHLAGQTFLRLIERIADFEWRRGLSFT